MINSKATRLRKVPPVQTHFVAHDRLHGADPAGVKMRSVLHLLAALCLGLASLEFREKLGCFDTLCSQPINPAGDVDFSIQLLNGKGRSSSPVNLSSFARIYRPVSAYSSYSFNNALFQTVRIPVQAFYGADFSQFKGLRFSFDRTPRARVSFGNIRLVKAPAGVFQ